MIKSCLVVEGDFSTPRIYPFYRKVAIGRSSRNDIILPDPTVSKRHALVGRVKGQTVVKDLDSRNGTFLNGKAIRKAGLYSGDALQVGNATLRFFQEEKRSKANVADGERTDRRRKRLGEHLVDAGVIDERTLRGALERKEGDERIGEILIEMGVVDEEDVAAALAKQLKLPLIRLQGLDVPQEVVSLVPPELAGTRLLLPVRRVQDRLQVAMCNPLDFHALQILRVATGMKIEPAVATFGDIREAFERWYPLHNLERALDSEPDIDDVTFEP